MANMRLNIIFIDKNNCILTGKSCLESGTNNDSLLLHSDLPEHPVYENLPLNKILYFITNVKSSRTFVSSSFVASIRWG